MFEHHAAKALMVLVLEGSLAALSLVFYYSPRTELYILWRRPTVLLQHFRHVLATSVRI